MSAHHRDGAGKVAFLGRRTTIVASLLLFFFLALQAAFSSSPTADEGRHMLSGLTLWQTRKIELKDEHPPLSFWLIGSLFNIEPTLPSVEQLPSWTDKDPIDLVQEFLWQSGVNVSRLLFLSRLPIIFAALCFGALLGRWSDRYYGPLALLITMVFFAFSPNFLAFSALATTDLVSALTFTTAVLMVWSYWQRPSVFSWLLASLALGLGLSAKLTGILLLPISFILSYINLRQQPWWKPALIWLSWIPMAFLVLWLLYGFELSRIEGLAVPIPAGTFVNNFVEGLDHLDRGHYAYLLGERSNQGWWYYFLLAFLFKTPIVVLLLLILAVIGVVRNRLWLRSIYLWLPIAVFFAAASVSGLNIGYRHILPVLPLVWLFIAMAAQNWQPNAISRRLIYAALALYAVLAVRQAPHFLSYFNELVGGPANGYKILGDSNIDWGQDLELLADYVNNWPGENVFISYFGPSDPEYYGLNFQPLFDEKGVPQNFARANPAAGRYFISVNHWQGATEIDPDGLAWFREKEPVDRVGSSILVFDVGEQLSGSWIGHCTDPEPRFDEKTAELLVGTENPRHLYFDCRSSWLLPSGGSLPGWFILPADVDPVIMDHLFPNQLRRVYENLNSPFSQPYAVFYWPGMHAAEESLMQVSGTIQVGGQPEPGPLPIGGIANFLGAARIESTWVSIWQTLQASELPLSVMMHIVDEQKQRQVGDGLGFSPIQWQKDDIFLQIAESTSDSGQFLETGLYNFATGEQLPLFMGDQSDSTIRVLSP